MSFPINWSPDIKRHLEAGHFNVFPRRWMNNSLIWYWQRGDDPTAKWIGPLSTRKEAEDAALEWWNSSQELKDAGLSV